MRPIRTAALLLALSGAANAQEFLYALSSYTNPSLLKIDPLTGNVLASMPVTGMEALFGGLAIDAAGSLWSIDGYNDPNPDRLFRIDRNTGQGGVVGPTGFNWNFRTVHANPVNDVLYAATDNRLYTIDRNSGAATFVANVTGSTLDQLTAMAIDATGRAYITDIGNTGLFSLNLATGQAAHIGDIGGSGNWFDDLAFNSAGVLHGSRTGGGLYTIDVNTAQQTFRWSGIYRGLAFQGASFTLTAVTSGNGVGDLTLGITGIPGPATHAWLLLSGTPAPGGPGTGQWFGLFFPDPLLFAFLTLPSAPFFLPHFPVTANPYAAGPRQWPPGTFSALAGQAWDLTVLAYSYAAGIAGQAPVVRVRW